MSGEQSSWPRFWDVALKLSVPLLIALGAVVIDNRADIRVIRSTRFTDRDAAELMNSTADAVGKLERKIDERLDRIEQALIRATKE